MKRWTKAISLFTIAAVVSMMSFTGCQKEKEQDEPKSNTQDQTKNQPKDNTQDQAKDQTQGQAIDWKNADIGDVGNKGGYTSEGGAYTISGDGWDIMDYEDAFHFVYTQWSGDGQIVARVTSVDGSHEWVKAGIMMRESLDADSKNAYICKPNAHGITFTRRLETGDATTVTRPFDVKEHIPYWIKLTREKEGDEYIFNAYESADGKEWTETGTDIMQMADTIYVGIAVTSHNRGVLSKATIDNVKIEKLEAK